MNSLWDILVHSIAEYLYSLFVFWLALAGSSKTAQLVTILSNTAHQNI